MKEAVIRILEDRERRWNYQNTIIDPLEESVWLVLGSNIPGINKELYLSNYLIFLGFKNIKRNFNIKSIKHYMGSDGLYLYFKVDEDYKEAKNKAINIENSDLGRFLDIDIIVNNRLVSRKDINLPRRRCFVCNEDAVYCIRNKTHKLELLISTIEKECTKYIFFEDKEKILARILELSCIVELSRRYSYGCVSVYGTGSHNDMDIISFLKSIEAMSGFYIKENFQNIENFDGLRELGLRIERKMLDSNNGTNTYKGLIFLSLFVANSFFKGLNLNEYSKDIKEISKDIYDDFNSNIISNGIQIYKEFGVKGIREIPFTGFEIIEYHMLPKFREDKNIDNLVIEIMNSIMDTTSIKRIGMTEYMLFKKMVEDVLNGFEDKKSLQEYSLLKNINTGGVADILIITLIYYFIQIFEGGSDIDEINQKWNLWKFTIQ